MESGFHFVQAGIVQTPCGSWTFFLSLQGNMLRICKRALQKGHTPRCQQTTRLHSPPPPLGLCFFRGHYSVSVPPPPLV